MKLWNVGIKVRDVASEVAFFQGLGARTLVREEASSALAAAEYTLLSLGGTRLFVASRPLFEQAMSGALPEGLTHMVFESDESRRLAQAAVALGARVLVGPTELEGAFGRREITFLRSPGGAVFELMTIHEGER